MRIAAPGVAVYSIMPMYHVDLNDKKRSLHPQWTARRVAEHLCRTSRNH